MDDDGIPIFAFPAASIIPVRPPSPSQVWGIFGGSVSQFRIYISPTLTAGLGIAMCFGPYDVGDQYSFSYRRYSR